MKYPCEYCHQDTENDSRWCCCECGAPREKAYMHGATVYGKPITIDDFAKMYANGELRLYDTPGGNYVA